jgi:outer membrane murein-binding lipoprotein Lpp
MTARRVICAVLVLAVAGCNNSASTDQKINELHQQTVEQNKKIEELQTDVQTLKTDQSTNELMKDGTALHFLLLALAATA